jgi:hypothetical protein
VEADGGQRIARRLPNSSKSLPEFVDFLILTEPIKAGENPKMITQAAGSTNTDEAEWNRFRTTGWLDHQRLSTVMTI